MYDGGYTEYADAMKVWVLIDLNRHLVVLVNHNDPANAATACCLDGLPPEEALAIAYCARS